MSVGALFYAAMKLSAARGDRWTHPARLFRPPPSGSARGFSLEDVAYESFSELLGNKRFGANSLRPASLNRAQRHQGFREFGAPFL
jgi:hypothetical protein